MDTNAQIEERLLKARAIASRAEEDGNRDFTDEERTEVQALVNEAAQLRKEQKERSTKAATDQGLLAQIKDLGEPLTAEQAKQLNTNALADAVVGSMRQPLQTLGDRFIQSKELQGLLAKHPNGFGREARVQMDPMNVGAIRNLVGGVGSPDLPGFWQPDSQGVLGPIWGRDLIVRQAITVGRTTSDSVEYARQLSQTNAAAPVPEATESGTVDGTVITIAEGGVKPKSDFTFEKATATVETIAHWMAATKKALSDAGQLRTLIDAFLRFGLEEELEDQIVSGNGTGDNFTGILNTSGVQAQAYSVSPIETMRKAITKVRVTGRARPTAVGLNPADDEALDLAKDSQNRYYGNGPFGAGPSTIWGLPRIVSEAFPAGTAVVADWRFAVLWDREQATVSATDSHADFFIRNLVAVLAELRAAFGVIRPPAFVIADLTA
jgi:hypothetical protein